VIVMVMGKLISVNRIHNSYGSLLIDDDVASVVIRAMNERPSLRVLADHIDFMVVRIYDPW
jgi:hypothetical protein